MAAHTYIQDKIVAALNDVGIKNVFKGRIEFEFQEQFEQATRHDTGSGMILLAAVVYRKRSEAVNEEESISDRVVFTDVNHVWSIALMIGHDPKRDTTSMINEYWDSFVSRIMQRDLQDVWFSGDFACTPGIPTMTQDAGHELIYGTKVEMIVGELTVKEQTAEAS